MIVDLEVFYQEKQTRLMHTITQVENRAIIVQNRAWKVSALNENCSSDMSAQIEIDDLRAQYLLIRQDLFKDLE